LAHPDLNELLAALFPMAEEMLTKQGAFYPFAASTKTDGQITLVGAHTGAEHPASQELLDQLTGGLRQSAEAGDIRAAGLCLDVDTVPPGRSKKTDAVCARLEHVEGEAVEVYLPYRKTWLGRVEFGETFTAPGTPTVFTAG
jgi:hypothetical protein